MTPPTVTSLDRLPALPWRNGLGRTIEIGQGPGWRASLATIAGDVAFSSFPGWSRHLAPAFGRQLSLNLMVTAGMTGSIEIHHGEQAIARAVATVILPVRGSWRLDHETLGVGQVALCTRACRLAPDRAGGDAPRVLRASVQEAAGRHDDTASIMR